MKFFLKYKGLSYYLYSLSPAPLLKTWYLGHRNASADVLHIHSLKKILISTCSCVHGTGTKSVGHETQKSCPQGVYHLGPEKNTW